MLSEVVLGCSGVPLSPGLQSCVSVLGFSPGLGGEVWSPRLGTSGCSEGCSEHPLGVDNLPSPRRGGRRWELQEGWTNGGGGGEGGESTGGEGEGKGVVSASSRRDEPSLAVPSSMTDLWNKDEIHVTIQVQRPRKDPPQI
jgi:hypothetical protein